MIRKICNEDLVCVIGGGKNPLCSEKGKSNILRTKEKDEQDDIYIYIYIYIILEWSK